MYIYEQYYDKSYVTLELRQIHPLGRLGEYPPLG